MNKIEYENIAAFHPGYYISDLINELEMTQDEFARRLKITPKNLSDLINAKASISENIAKNLSLMLGTSVDVWLELQKKYDQKVLEIKALQAIREEEKDLAKIDYSYFEGLGVVEPTKDKTQKIINLLKYFAISSFSVFKKPDFIVQFRQIQIIDDKIVLNSNAWVQTVINFGKELETKPYSEKKLKEYLPHIREMTIQKPSEYIPRLSRVLSECGVAFVFIPSLKNSGVYGATKWLNKEKVIVGMTDRGKNADVFWFSLFHELGHVFQRRITKTIIDFENSDSFDEYEKEADLFARNILIPSELYNSFVILANFSEKNILNFADSIGIHPGIVVGRLQKEGHLPYKYLNRLKQKDIIAK